MLNIFRLTHEFQINTGADYGFLNLHEPIMAHLGQNSNVFDAFADDLEAAT